MAKSKVQTTEKPVEMTVVEKAKAFYQRAKTYETDQRKEEMDDIRFVGLLEQWPAQLKAMREGDPTGARPCLVVDKVNQYVNQIVNQMRQNRPSIKARPVDDAGDIEVAEVYQGIIRHIEDSSKADIAYDWAGEGAVKSGVGYFRILTEYVGDSFQQEIRIARIRNRFTVYFDPDAKEPDGSDQKECLVTMMIKRDAFKEQYPDKDLTEWSASTGDSDWYDADHVRIAEYYYLEKTAATLVLLEDGNSMFKDEYEAKEIQLPIVKERAGYKTIVKWCKVTGSDELESTVIAGKFIPIVRVIGIETDIDGKIHLRGIVRGVKDAQRMYNYQRSTVVETLGLSSKAPYIAAAGQIEGFEAEWASSNRVNRAVLKYKPVTINGTLAPPPQRQAYSGVPTGLIQDMETSEHDIQAALGMYQASIGQDSNAKSGKALNAQRQQGDMATFQFPDNQSKSVRHAGRIIMGMIPVVYDTAQVVRMLGEDGTPDYVQLDPEQQEAVKQEKQVDGSIKKIYNLGVGKYDVTITTGASYATKRMEVADFMTQLVQTNPELMQMYGDYFFKSMDVPYAEEMADRAKKMLPPQLQDDPNSEDSPEVQQVKAQAQQAIDQLTQQLQAAEQAMQEADQEASELMKKAEGAEAKAGVEAGRIALDKEKLEVDKGKVEIDKIRAENERMQIKKEQMELMIANPDMANMMAQNDEMMQAMLNGVLESIEENKALLQQLAQPETKEIQIASPDGKVYRGIVQDGQVQVETPTGQVYTGSLNG
jgi:hypothetical protein